jgi:hypothetical protein
MAIIGCGEHPSEANTLDLSNVLSLESQGALAKTAYNCTDVADTVDIDVGCLLRSGNYYFVMDNTTEYELTDVMFTSSNPAFTATPAKIASIGVVGKSTGVTPLLRVAISHGTQLNDMSTPDPLDEGTAKTTLTITGKVNGQEFKQEYVIGGYAKVIDVVRKNGELYLEGPIYQNGKLFDHLRLYEEKDCLISETNNCASETLISGTVKSYWISFSYIEPVAPLGKAFTMVGGTAYIVDSLIINK